MFQAVSRKTKYAGMAELADALDSGSSESNFMEVQVLLPAPKKIDKLLLVDLFLHRGLEGELVGFFAPASLKNGGEGLLSYENICFSS